jgi:anti-sigma B factor antagonist
MTTDFDPSVQKAATNGAAANGAAANGAAANGAAANGALTQFTAKVTTPVDGIVVVALAGELDLSCAAELGQTLGGLAEAGDGRFVIDLSQLEFIDSTGISALLSAAKRIHERGGTMVVAQPAASVSHLFEILQLEKLIPIESSLDQALLTAAAHDA